MKAEFRKRKARVKREPKSRRNPFARLPFDQSQHLGKQLIGFFIGQLAGELPFFEQMALHAELVEKVAKSRGIKPAGEY
jgi:hypothetical protein